MNARPTARRDLYSLLACLVAAWQLLTPFVHGLHRHTEPGPDAAGVTCCGHSQDHDGPACPADSSDTDEPEPRGDCSICHAYAVARTSMVPDAMELAPTFAVDGPAQVDLTPQRGSQHALTPRSSRGPPAELPRA